MFVLSWVLLFLGCRGHGIGKLDTSDALHSEPLEVCGFRVHSIRGALANNGGSQDMKEGVSRSTELVCCWWASVHLATELVDTTRFRFEFAHACKAGCASAKP